MICSDSSIESSSSSSSSSNVKDKQTTPFSTSSSNINESGRLESLFDDIYNSSHPSYLHYFSASQLGLYTLPINYACYNILLLFTKSVIMIYHITLSNDLYSIILFCLL